MKILSNIKKKYGPVSGLPFLPTSLPPLPPQFQIAGLIKHSPILTKHIFPWPSKVKNLSHFLRSRQSIMKALSWPATKMNLLRPTSLMMKFHHCSMNLSAIHPVFTKHSTPVFLLCATTTKIISTWHPCSTVQRSVAPTLFQTQKRCAESAKSESNFARISRVNQTY